ncbi:MAG TPA: hypothetical protein VM096_19770 [Vicinamibacterales bacterium]|nr:hypothetical protein [Vicinamibacterales bacterium]
MRPNRALWSIVILIAIAVLAAVGQRISPTTSTPTAGKSDRKCDVDAPKELKQVAQHWCVSGIVAKVAVRVDENNVVTVVHFSPNGGQAFQLQSANIVNTFRTLTDEMAGASPGRNVSVAVQAASDERIAACARRLTDKSAICEVSE